MNTRTYRERLAELDREIMSRAVRKGIKLQTELPERLGMCYNTFRAKRSGKAAWTLKDLYLLSETLEVSLEELIPGGKVNGNKTGARV